MIYVQMLAVSVLLGIVHGQDGCTVGDLLASTVSSSLVGRLFLDIGNPAPCTGTITAWHFCYYEPERIRDAQDFTALFQVWRPIESSTDYRRVSQTSQTVSVLNTGRSENFECGDMSLQESDFIPIEENDILGVYIPGLNGLRLVSENFPSESELFFINPGPDVSSVTTSETAQLLTEHELHLTADIVMALDMATMPPIVMTTNPPIVMTTNPPIVMTTNPPIGVTTNSTTLNDSTTAESVVTTPTTTEGARGSMQSAQGLSGGDIAGIVIAMLIIIGVVAAGIVVLLVLWWYKKGRGSSWSKNLKRKSADVSAYDNAIYDEAPIRANSALANYLNSTFSGPSTDYEIPINTKATENSIPLPRNQMESMYVSMDSANLETPLDPDCPDFIDSFEAYAASEGESSVHKRQRRTKEGNSTDAVFDIYRSFGPENEIYCQFMEETVSQKGTLPHRLTGDFDPYADPPTDEEEICHNLSTKTRNIDHSEIEILGEIGSGQFAFVNKAQWIDKSGANLTVAVKSLHSPASQEERVKFLQEAAIMSQFVHPNVVRLIGTVKTAEEISLVTEYCAKGDLSVSLKEMQSESGELPPDTAQNLLSYSQQVALAMHYLSTKGFVHRDLAARNIFVTQENICKLGDFGMSRDLANAEYYLSQGGAIPVRWTAPEAVYYRKYSTASDIWSYGCLLFEIWSVGKKPFNGLPNTEVLETVKTGYRLPPPPGCPEAIFKIMIQCWNPETKPRPAFRDILESMLCNDKELLHISAEDATSHELATQLGAALDAGKGMYLSLQHTYLKQLPTNKRETIYEAIEQFSSSLDFLPKNSPAPYNGAPPLPSSPIPRTPLTPKASIQSLGNQPYPPAIPPSSSSHKSPLIQQSSLLSLLSQPTFPLHSNTKPPPAQKPSLSSSQTARSPSRAPPTNEKPWQQQQMTNEQPGDALYDDVVSVMSPRLGNSTSDDFTEGIYDDIADSKGGAPDTNVYEVPPDSKGGAPDTNVYKVPPDAVTEYNPYDVDYEDI